MAKHFIRCLAVLLLFSLLAVTEQKIYKKDIKKCMHKLIEHSSDLNKKFMNFVEDHNDNDMVKYAGDAYKHATVEKANNFELLRMYSWSKVMSSLRTFAQSKAAFFLLFGKQKVSVTGKILPAFFKEFPKTLAAYAEDQKWKEFATALVKYYSSVEKYSVDFAAVLAVSIEECRDVIKKNLPGFMCANVVDYRTEFQVFQEIAKAKPDILFFLHYVRVAANKKDTAKAVKNFEKKSWGDFFGGMLGSINPFGAPKVETVSEKTPTEVPNQVSVFLLLNYFLSIKSKFSSVSSPEIQELVNEIADTSFFKKRLLMHLASYVSDSTEQKEEKQKFKNTFNWKRVKEVQEKAQTTLYFYSNARKDVKMTDIMKNDIFWLIYVILRSNSYLISHNIYVPMILDEKLLKQVLKLGSEVKLGNNFGSATFICAAFSDPVSVPRLLISIIDGAQDLIKLRAEIVSQNAFEFGKISAAYKAFLLNWFSFCEMHNFSNSDEEPVSSVIEDTDLKAEFDDAFILLEESYRNLERSMLEVEYIVHFGSPAPYLYERYKNYRRQELLHIRSILIAIESLEKFFELNDHSHHSNDILAKYPQMYSIVSMEILSFSFADKFGLLETLANTIKPLIACTSFFKEVAMHRFLSVSVLYYMHNIRTDKFSNSFDFSLETKKLRKIESLFKATFLHLYDVMLQNEKKIDLNFLSLEKRIQKDFKAQEETGNVVELSKDEVDRFFILGAYAFMNSFKINILNAELSFFFVYTSRMDILKIAKHRFQKLFQGFIDRSKSLLLNDSDKISKVEWKQLKNEAISCTSAYLKWIRDYFSILLHEWIGYDKEEEQIYLLHHYINRDTPKVTLKSTEDFEKFMELSMFIDSVETKIPSCLQQGIPLRFRKRRIYKAESFRVALMDDLLAKEGSKLFEENSNIFAALFIQIADFPPTNELIEKTYPAWSASVLEMKMNHVNSAILSSYSRFQLKQYDPRIDHSLHWGILDIPGFVLLRREEVLCEIALISLKFSNVSIDFDANHEDLIIDPTEDAAKWHAYMTRLIVLASASADLLESKATDLMNCIEGKEPVSKLFEYWNHYVLQLVDDFYLLKKLADSMILYDKFKAANPIVDILQKSRGMLDMGKGMLNKLASESYDKFVSVPLASLKNNMWRKIKAGGRFLKKPISNLKSTLYSTEEKEEEQVVAVKVQTKKEQQDMEYLDSKMKTVELLLRRINISEYIVRARHHHIKFPGAQPVSFERKHLNVLESTDYYVCEKSDGHRYLLFMALLGSGPAAFLINRKCEFYRVDVFFPTKQNVKQPHHETLLDGELVVEIEENGEKSCKFMIFDLMIINSKNVTNESLLSRLNIAQKEVFAPFNFMLEKFPDYKQKLPFQVFVKQMHKSYGISEIFHQIIPSLKHGNDGLIFTPVNYPYISGTCNELLKWKPAELNTVDFQLDVAVDEEGQSRLVILIGIKGDLSFYDYFTATEEFNEKLGEDDPVGKIVECNYDKDLAVSVFMKTLPDSDGEWVDRKGGWKFNRFRTDKSTPNDISTVTKILDSISDNVTQKDLEDRLPSIRRNWKSRESQPIKRMKKEH